MQTFWSIVKESIRMRLFDFICFLLILAAVASCSGLAIDAIVNQAGSRYDGLHTITEVK